MTSQHPREPQPTEPDEPGWWIASDGMWYPPELAPSDSPSPAPVMPEMAPTSAHGFETPATADTADSAETAPERDADTSDDEPASVPPSTAPPEAFAEPAEAPEADAAVASPPSSTAPSRANGAAIAALIFGLLSIFGGIAGIPAVICGAIGMRKPAKRWMAIVGFALGGVFLVAWLATGAVIGIGALRADPNAKTSGSAPSSSYGITIDECKLTATGEASIRGTLTNKTKRTKSFEVVATLSAQGAEPERTTRLVVTAVPAKATAEYRTEPEQLPLAVKVITCRIVDVRNAR